MSRGDQLLVRWTARIRQSSANHVSDPERIHLGPPRNSFASSNARTRNGTYDRTKTGDDDKNGAGTNGKHHNRPENENDLDRSRKRYDEDDGDTRQRRDYDRPRWGARDAQADTPWARRDRRGENEQERPAWRRGARDNDRIDEPEWADSIEPSDTPKQHTQDDLAQFLAQMKNKDKTATEPLASAQPLEEKKPQEHPPARVVSDTSTDKFFARFAERSSSDATTAAKPTKSRFASLFGSKEEPKPDLHGPGPAVASNDTFPIPLQPSAELEQPAQPVDNNKKAIDQAAFNNVLAMLQRNSVSPNVTSQPSKTPVNIAELAASKTPTIDAAIAKTQISRTPSQSHTPTLSIDRLIESRSPAQHNQQGRIDQPKDSAQQLLNLLQRKPAQDKPQQTQAPLQHIFPQYGEYRMPPQIPPGFGPPPNHEQNVQGAPLISTRRDAPRSIFDDPAFAGYQREQEFTQRSPPPGLGGMAGLFASVNEKSFNQNGQEDARPHLQRPPPGFENAPRPPPGSGWPANPPRQYNADASQAPYGQSRTAYPQPQPGQPMPQRKPTGGPPPGFPPIPPGFGPSPTYAAPGSPETATQHPLRGWFIQNEREGERERPQQSMQYQARVPMTGSGVQVPPGFR